jgi:PAS domain S-box-containing protein
VSLQANHTALEKLLAEQSDKLREREHDLRSILDNMSAMIGYWDRDLRNRFGNHAYHDWFGIDPARMPGMHIRDVIGEERFQLNFPYMQKALLGERQQFERPIPTPDGSSIRYSLAEYIPDIRDGEVQGFFVLVSDVTRLKETETALRDSEMRFRKLFEDSAAPLLLLEGDTFTDGNAAAAALLRLSDRAAVKGMTFDEISPALQPDGEPSAGRVSEMVAAAHASGSSLFEWECVRADGNLFIAEVLLTSIQADRRLVHVELRDITARKAMEGELRRSNAELETFAYAASHDMRQPLRMISSYLGLLDRRLGSLLDDEGRSYFKFAIDGARRLDRMIAGLLDYARIGRSSREKEAVSLSQALDRVIETLEQAIEDAGAEVVVPPDLPSLPGFASEIERLFQNLIGNAIKFRIPGRAPRVEVECREMAREWVIAVTDNGIGIPKDRQNLLFTVFQRLVSDTDYEGTGIGLASCRKIAERHGGRIWIESDEGKGCTFLVALPKG